MADCFVVGVGSTRFDKHPERSHRDLADEAIRSAFADAELDRGVDLASAWFGNCAMGVFGQDNIRGQVCLDPLMRSGLLPQRLPIVNVEAGCATGSSAFHAAFKDVASGLSPLSLAVGVEKVLVPDDPARTFALFAGGIDQLHREEWQTFFREAGERGGQRFEPHPHRVMFLDIHAMHARAHMAKYGTTVEQIAKIACKNHHHGVLNDLAQYRFEVSMEQALADRPVVEPFTRSMCCPVSDGAAAILVGSARWLASQPASVRERALKIRASVLTGGAWRELGEPNVAWHAAHDAYARAGIRGRDVHVAEVHDATAFCELQATECLGLAPEGQGGAFVDSGASQLDGVCPVNPSGGLISKGHPLAATGLGMIQELALQLRREAGERQIANEDATIGVQHNAGGLIGFDEALCSVAVLERV